jgi:O-antigen ligase
MVGSGFGNDFLEESGTKAFLEGTTYNNVRSPHNWFVGIYARMGVIGLGLIAAVVVQLVFIMWRNRVRIGSDPLLSMCALIILSILPVATLGVVLEAPFGAVPFFWAAGILMTLSGPVRPQHEFSPDVSLKRNVAVLKKRFTSP